MKIYIDESGDLGFSERASPYYVLAAIVEEDDTEIRRCFKRVRNRKLKKKLRDFPEFKFSTSAPTSAAISSTASEMSFRKRAGRAGCASARPRTRSVSHSIIKTVWYGDRTPAINLVERRARRRFEVLRADRRHPEKDLGEAVVEVPGVEVHDLRQL